MDKQKKKKRRWAVTLVEMIIVMILITTITGAIAYNYKSSLDQGRLFKTKEGIKRIETISMLLLAEEPQLKNDTAKLKEMIKKHPLATGQEDFLKDGWGEEYTITPAPDTADRCVIVHSSNIERFEKKK